MSCGSLQLFRLKLVRPGNPTERLAVRCIQKWNNRRVVIADRVYFIDGEVVGIIRILLRLVSRKESPTAVVVVIRCLSIHVANLHAVNSDSVRSKATAHFWYEPLDLFTGDLECFFARIHKMLSRLRCRLV